MNDFILQIKKLRKLTFASINDCKKSLIITQGNIEKAINLLKNKSNHQGDIKKNIEKLIEHKGIIIFKNTGIKCIKFHLLCKTDFCSRSLNMKILSEVIKNFLFALTYILPGKYNSINDLYLASHDEKYIYKIIKEYESFLKEQINIKCIVILHNESPKKIATYLHHDKLQGAIINYKIISYRYYINNSLFNFFNNLSMHTMAFNPRFINYKHIFSSFLKNLRKNTYLKNKKTIFLKKRSIGKSIMIKMLDKISKDICLVNQNFLIYDKSSIKKIIKIMEDLLNIQINIKNIYIFKITY